MTASTSVHPDEVFEALLAGGGRPQKIRNLKAIHEVCRRHHERASRDFSIKTIGRLTEEHGGITWRAIYQTNDYRKLIEAWASYAGPSETRQRALKKLPLAQSFLARIEDPAIRSIMEGVIIERDKLRGENNLLRALPRGVIDRRPLDATLASTHDSDPVVVLSPSIQLNESERSALKKTIDADFLADNNWVEGSHGEILNQNGRTVFEVGFTSAIRKILKDT